MADPDQFELSKMQLAGSLNAVAESMRNCANIADHFSQVVKNTPFSAETALQVIHGLGKNSPLPTTAAGKRKAKAMEEDLADPDSKKKRKAKKPKKIRDPDMPKRPASSYLLFQNEIRKELKSKNPSMSQSELLSTIAKQWAEMSLEQKLVYTSATATAKEKYHQEKAAYDAKVPSATVGVAPPTPTAAPVPPMPTPANKTAKPVKSQPVMASSDSGSSDSGSDESSEEEDDDDDDDEEEVKEQPSAKKAKHSIPLIPKVKKQNRA